MAQPLRRQVFTVVVILVVVAYAAIGYGARITYNEHVRQLAAQTGAMAATRSAWRATKLFAIIAPFENPVR